MNCGFSWHLADEVEVAIAFVVARAAIRHRNPAFVWEP
jgi:hypothetical protein